MTYNRPDPYYQPEHFGLTQVGEIDDWDACYSFDLLVVWQHADGLLYWATDAGCSCPSPFEDYTTLEELTALTDDTFGEFADAVKAHCEREWNKALHDYACEKNELLAKVSGLLRLQGKAAA